MNEKIGFEKRNVFVNNPRNNKLDFLTQSIDDLHKLTRVTSRLLEMQSRSAVDLAMWFIIDKHWS